MVTVVLNLPIRSFHTSLADPEVTPPQSNIFNAFLGGGGELPKIIGWRHYLWNDLRLFLSKISGFINQNTLHTYIGRNAFLYRYLGGINIKSKFLSL